MIHLEGGWPKNVNISDMGSKTQYQKKIEKLEGYLKTVKSLTDPVISNLNQNIALDMYQFYFPERSEDSGHIKLQNANEENTAKGNPVTTSNNEEAEWMYENPSATILAVFKDPSSTIQKRTASCISWYPNDFSRLAVSYCPPQEEKKSDNQIDNLNSYIWNIMNPNQPEMTLSPSSPLTCLAYNSKDISCLVSGALNGTIFFFDTRRGSFSVDYSHMHNSHRDPVYDVKWVQSKQNTECVSISIDGLILVWDVRNLGQPIEKYTLKQKEGTSTSGNSTVLGAISMEYDTSYSTSKFLIGTEQGVIVSWNRKSKKKTEKMYYGHHGSVYNVQRNPFLPKYFLSIGDWAARIWYDDLWKSPIMETKYYESYLTAGCWSLLKPGVFFTTKMDGSIDIWDYCHNQTHPAVSMSLSNSGLYSIKPSVGKYIAVGAADGSVSFLELSENLCEKSNNDEKKMFSDMLEREGKLSKALENIAFNRSKMDSVVDITKLDEMLAQLQKNLSEEQEMTQKTDPVNRYLLTEQELKEIEEEFHKEVLQSKEELNQQLEALKQDEEQQPATITTSNDNYNT